MNETWAKGYSRLAEVYGAQDRYELAMEAYAKAIKLCPEAQKVQYQTLYEKAMAKHLDPRWVNAGIHDPMKSGEAAMFARFRARVPKPQTFGLGSNLNPLGYLTAADKICNGFHFALRRLIPRFLQWTAGLNNLCFNVRKDGEYVSFPSDVIAQLTNALAQDMRGFYLDDVDKQFPQFNLLINGELFQPYVMDPTMSVQDIVAHFQVHGCPWKILIRTEEPQGGRMGYNSTSDGKHNSSCIPLRMYHILYMCSH